MLYYGADWLVKGSASLAKSMGITPIVIGLTVVAFGTSAPELVVSLISSLQGKSMIAIGNVIGSNICNIALVLGTASVFQPIMSNRSVINRDIPLMLVISLYLFFLSMDSIIGRMEGVTLFVGVLLYTYFNYRMAVKSPNASADNEVNVDISEVEEAGGITSRKKQIIMIIAGITGVVAGAQLVVESAVKIMTILGVSEKFIGLTIVAFGTSLPELATSVVAAIKKEMDISLGNLVGSNVFNIMSVLGASAMVKAIPIQGGFFESGLIIDYAVMMFISFLPWLLMRKNFVLTRVGGVSLLSCYGGYMIYLIQKG